MDWGGHFSDEHGLPKPMVAVISMKMVVDRRPVGFQNSYPDLESLVSHMPQEASSLSRMWAEIALLGSLGPFHFIFMSEE